MANSTPVWTPLLNLLKNEAVIAALITAFVDTLILLVPGLLPLREQFISLFTLIMGMIVAALLGGQVIDKNNDAKVQIAQTQVQSAQLALETARAQAAQGVTIGSQWTATSPTWNSGTLTPTAPVIK